MRRTALTFLPLLTLLTGCAMHSHEEMISAATNVDDRFVAAFSQGSVPGVMDTYWNNPNVVLYPPGELVARGYPAIQDSYTRFFQAAPGAKLEIGDRHYEVAGDVILGRGLFRITIPAPASAPAGSQPMVMEGRFTQVTGFRDNKWVYLLDHPSVPLPPPAAPPATAPR